MSEDDYYDPELPGESYRDQLIEKSTDRLENSPPIDVFEFIMTFIVRMDKDKQQELSSLMVEHYRDEIADIIVELDNEQRAA